MSALSEPTRQKIKSLFNDFRQKMEHKGLELNLDDINSGIKPMTEAIFKNNFPDYIHLMVAQRISGSFSGILGNLVEPLSQAIITGSGGKIVDGNPKPFDLKFTHLNGDEYWVELKSIDGQNKSNKETIGKNRKDAIEQGKKFLLCIYNNEKQDKKDWIISGANYWNFIGNNASTWEELEKLLSQFGEDFKIASIIENRVKELNEENISKDSERRDLFDF